MNYKEYITSEKNVENTLRLAQNYLMNLIHTVPSGELRNQLTQENIELMLYINGFDCDNTDTQCPPITKEIKEVNDVEVIIPEGYRDILDHEIVEQTDQIAFCPNGKVIWHNPDHTEVGRVKQFAGKVVIREIESKLLII